MTAHSKKSIFFGKSLIFGIIHDIIMDEKKQKYILYKGV